VDPFALNGADEVIVTRVFDRWQSHFVEGYVRRRGEWLFAEFAVCKADCEYMSRDAFMAFAKRQLPTVTVDRPWEREQGVQRVA
jgi:hypothetical protein